MLQNWRAVAALLAAASLSGESARAAEPAVSLRILWVESGFGNPLVRDVGLTEARAILAPYDVGVVWRSGSPATESREDEIRVVPMARRLGEKSGRRILGATASSADGPRTVWLDSSRGVAHWVQLAGGSHIDFHFMHSRDLVPHHQAIMTGRHTGKIARQVAGRCARDSQRALRECRIVPRQDARVLDRPLGHGRNAQPDFELFLEAKRMVKIE
jgi:hypothetical protein